MATPIEIAYAAHTSVCTFLLDDQGICRRIVMTAKGKRRESARTSARCVGAQYVASLDGSAAGGLVEMPRVGAAMLFARVDESGRISLVRTGAITSFESRAGEDPFVDPVSVETSAPRLGGLEAVRAEQAAPARRNRDDWHPRGRTQPLQALRTDDSDDERTPAAGNDLTTAEYPSLGDYPPPSVWPTPPSEPPPTVRCPPPYGSDVHITRRGRGG